MQPGSDGGFRIERTTAGAMTIIAVFGELDLVSKPRLAEEVDAGAPRQRPGRLL